MTFLTSVSWRTPAPRRRSPGYIEPCIPTRSSKPPKGPQWVHEIKHDGYRLIVCKQDGRVRLFTRRGYDWTDRYPLIREAAAALRARSVTIDGEAVYCDQTGMAIFENLHSRAHDDRVFLYAFDLLELDGVDYRPQELCARKIRLERLLAKVRGGIAFNEHLAGDGAMIFKHACKLGFEGIVSKHREWPYRSGRSKSWIKVKNPASPAMLRLEDWRSR
jgi:bifunctional non-homologous end joining protein LigD